MLDSLQIKNEFNTFFDVFRMKFLITIKGVLNEDKIYGISKYRNQNNNNICEKSVELEIQTTDKLIKMNLTNYS